MFRQAQSRKCRSRYHIAKTTCGIRQSNYLPLLLYHIPLIGVVTKAGLTNLIEVVTKAGLTNLIEVVTKAGLTNLIVVVTKAGFTNLIEVVTKAGLTVS